MQAKVKINFIILVIFLTLSPNLNSSQPQTALIIYNIEIAVPETLYQGENFEIAAYVSSNSNQSYNVNVLVVFSFYFVSTDGAEILIIRSGKTNELGISLVQLSKEETSNIERVKQIKAEISATENNGRVIEQLPSNILPQVTTSENTREFSLGQLHLGLITIISLFGLIFTRNRKSDYSKLNPKI